MMATLCSAIRTADRCTFSDRAGYSLLGESFVRTHDALLLQLLPRVCVLLPINAAALWCASP